jgi:N6-L-threonylcarbamoyladenine synthase
LKTSVLYFLRDNKNYKLEDVAASFQHCASEVLLRKTFRAARNLGIRKILLAGGVAANSYLRNSAVSYSKKYGYEVLFPPIDLCTDNGAMIARAGIEKINSGKFDSLELNAIPNLRLED